MTYVVITEHGGLVIRQQPATLVAVAAEVGPHGWARVHVNDAWWMAAWVSDCGPIMPEVYRRNIVGSCLLACLGAAQQPYAGPIVITDYDHDDDWGAPVNLGPIHIGAIREQHAAIRAALDSSDTPGPEWATPEWAARIREFAEYVKTCDAPVMTLHTLGEVL